GVAAVGLGAAAGFALDRAAAAPAVTVAPAMQTLVTDGSKNTVAVRLELSKSCWRMFLDEPLLGRGAGGFAVDYPRYRSQREIELSSFGREFETSPLSAHDDYLQLLVEGGALALLLWLLGSALLLRAASLDRARLLPFVAFAALMAVRSPLGNAPAAALLFVLLGPMLEQQRAATPRPQPRRQWPWGWPWRVGGAVLAYLGLQPLLVNQAFAPYQAARAHAQPVDLAALEGAGTWCCRDARI